MVQLVLCQYPEQCEWWWIWTTIFCSIFCLWFKEKKIFSQCHLTKSRNATVIFEQNTSVHLSKFLVGLKTLFMRTWIFRWCLGIDQYLFHGWRNLGAMQFFPRGGGGKRNMIFSYLNSKTYFVFYIDDLFLWAWYLIPCVFSPVSGLGM